MRNHTIEQAYLLWGEDRSSDLERSRGRDRGRRTEKERERREEKRERQAIQNTWTQRRRVKEGREWGGVSRPLISCHT